MATGLGLLRLSPDAFWSMTLREFSAAATGLFGQRLQRGAPSRAALAALMSRFPDKS